MNTGLAQEQRSAQLIGPINTDSQRLETLKKVVISGIEQAYKLISYGDLYGIENNTGQDSETERTDKLRAGRILDDKEEYNPKIENYYLLDYIKESDDYDKPKKEIIKPYELYESGFKVREQTKKERIDEFRRRVHQLEEKGDVKSLEILLTSAHDVVTAVPDSTEDYLAFLARFSDSDQVYYASLISHLFRDKKKHEAVSHLLRTTKKDTDVGLKVKPKPKSKGKIDKVAEIEENPYFDAFEPVKYKRIPEYLDLEIKKLYLRDNIPKYEKFNNNENLKFEREFTKYLERKSPIRQFIGQPHANANFFTRLKDMYGRFNEDVVTEWVKSANVLLDDEHIDVLTLMRLSDDYLGPYISALGLDVKQFFDDYKIFGTKGLYTINRFARIPYLTSERKKSLARHLLTSRDITKLEDLTQMYSHFGDITPLENLLPDGISDKDFIGAAFRTKETYSRAGSTADNLIGVRLGRLKKAESIEDYFTSLASIEELASKYKEFIGKRINHVDNFGNIMPSLSLYLDFLDKNFEQFERDFDSFEKGVLMLPAAKRTLGTILGGDRLKSVVNYLARQRNNNLIERFSNYDCPNEITTTLVRKLDSKIGKKDLIDLLTDIENTYGLYKTSGVQRGSFINRILTLEQNSSYEDARKLLIELRREPYFDLIGKDIEIPEGLEDKLRKLLPIYRDTDKGKKGGVDIRQELRFIAQNYVKLGPEGTFEAIDNLPKNKRLRKNSKKNGVNIDAFEKGIRKTYTILPDKYALQRTKDTIRDHIEILNLKLDIIGYTAPIEIDGMDSGKLEEQLEKTEKFLGSQSTDIDGRLKFEIKDKIQRVRSFKGTLKNLETSVEFYVSQDPIEALLAGEYFNSCLRPDGINFWGAVANVMDSNKRVVYAKTADGKYIGRNRVILTDKGIITTRFYGNGSVDLNKEWIDYLSSYANETGQDVMIADSFANGMGKELSKMEKEGKVQLEQRTVHVDPAHTGTLHCDYLEYKMKKERGYKIQGNFYVIKPQPKTGNTENVSYQDNYSSAFPIIY